MKLQDALKRIFREFGMNVLKEKRFVFLLSDYKAFDDYPAVKQIIKAISDDGYRKELCRLGMDGSRDDCLNYAVRLKKSLSADRNFKPELAGFAVDCILFAMGLISSVREPSDHGFDPCGNGTPNPGQIGSATKSDGGAAPDDSMEILSGSWTSTAGTADITTVTEKIQRQSALQTDSTSSLGSPLIAPRAPAGQQNPNSAGSTDNQVPVQNSSGSSITPDQKYYSDKHYNLQSIAGWFTSKGRIGRTEFWCRIIVSLAVFTGLILLLLWCSRVFHHLEDAAILLGVFFFIVFLVSFVCTLVKRCHDLCWSGWAAFMLIWPLRFVPPLARNGSYWVLFVLSLFLGLYWIRICIGKGTDGENKYGPDPTIKAL